MDRDLDLRLVRLYDAPADAVFKAWVDPRAREQWYADRPDDEVHAETDLRVGGAWSVDFGRPGQRYREHGVFLELDPPNRAVYSQTFTYPDGRTFDTTITIELVDRDGKTELTLVEGSYPDVETRRGHESGWPGFLDRVADVLAKATDRSTTTKPSASSTSPAL
jgi:uncharacterized protein YndB with AHSA1/START domain